MDQSAGVLTVARKKPGDIPRGKGVLVRLSEDGAAAVHTIARFKNMSVARYFDLYLLPIARKDYNDSVVKEAGRIQRKEQP